MILDSGLLFFGPPCISQNNELKKIDNSHKAQRGFPQNLLPTDQFWGKKIQYDGAGGTK